MYNNQETIAHKNIKKLGEMGKGFIVPEYQRGYRWTTINVSQLIEDLFENLEEEYCLQTLIVHENDSGFNVIDGQQRLTAILIIISGLEYLMGSEFKKKPTVSYFSLEYKTRLGSKLFLEFLLSLSSESINLSWKNVWRAFYDKHNDKNLRENLDFRYMFQSFITVKEKLEEKIKQNRDIDYSVLYNYLLNKCEFIWYSLDSSDISNSLGGEEKQFYNINMGKISLTNSELIKSEFMSPECDENMDDYNCRVVLLAEKWYQIEIELRNPDFWAFIPHKNQYGIWNNDKEGFVERNNCLPRIDEIFQLFLLKKYGGSSEKYKEELEKEGYSKVFIYNNIKNWISEKNPKNSIIKKWNEFEELFSNIQELYNYDGRNTVYQSFYEQNKKVERKNCKNDNQYNLIGYTIYTLAIVLQKSEYEIGAVILKILEKNRNDRRKYLKKLIRDNLYDILSIDFDNFSNAKALEEKLKEIQYIEYKNDEKNKKDRVDERKDKNKELKNILLLFNIILLDKNPGISSRYDFLKYKYWSVEHIFSKNEQKWCSEDDEINRLQVELIEKASELENLKLGIQKKNDENIKSCKTEKGKENIKEEENKAIRRMEEGFEAEKKKIEDKLRKLNDRKKVFIIRKEIIGNLMEYYDNEEGQDKYLNHKKSNLNESNKYELEKLDKMKLVFNLMNHIEKLDESKENDIWEKIIEEEVIDKRKKEVLKIMCENNSKYKSIDELFYDITKNKDKVNVFAENIEEMFGLEELKLYIDLIEVYIGFASEGDSEIEQSYDTANNKVLKIIEIIEKAVIEKFKIKNTEKNRIILKEIYTNEVDEYFEGKPNSKSDYNLLLMDNSLRNLALLRNVENREIANEYIGKKEKIHKYINKGTIIPYSTLLVFTDRYIDLRKENNGERWQWLPSSRDKYFQDVLNTINKFLVGGE